MKFIFKKRKPKLSEQSFVDYFERCAGIGMKKEEMKDNLLYLEKYYKDVDRIFNSIFQMYNLWYDRSGSNVD